MCSYTINLRAVLGVFEKYTRLQILFLILAPIAQIYQKIWKELKSIEAFCTLAND